MYLKRLELLGFKSFAQKTTLEFPGGVTAIVGPNGSGKSNIIDALRWILGEREAKNIRAERSENLLYNGSGARSRAGFAQVEITFDNSTHFFPVDFSEVTIRRRVTRDGISSYYLNESEVRLRDIIDFFSKVRLGTKGFSIINQGNSDLFIKASPVERRTMLEEVLGLRQYQLKRHEAEGKLEATEVNLDKARALIEELLPHLRVLRRQAGRYEKHATVESELKEYEYAYFSGKLKQFHGELKEIDPQIEKVEKEIHHKEGELKERRGELERIEKQQPKGNTQFDVFKKQQQEIFGRRSQVSKELGRLEAELEFLLSRPKASVKEAELVSLVQETKRIINHALSATDFTKVKQQLSQLVGQIDQVMEGESRQTNSRQKEIEKLKKEFLGELEDLEKDLAELGNLEAKLADEMREFNNTFKAAFESVEAKKGEIQILESQKSRLGFDKERVTIKIKDLEHQATQAGRSIKDFEGHQSVSGEVSKLEPNELERKMLRLRGELASIGEIDPAMLKEAQATEERYTFLEAQIQDLEQASKDLQKLITDLKDKLHTEFARSLSKVNDEFNNYFRLMFGGGKAKLHVIKPEKPKPVESVEGEPVVVQVEEKEQEPGLEIELSIPRKNIKGLDLLSGGERSLVSIAVLFALISVSPPPFLVLDEVDAALDESNTKRFATLIESFSGSTQFLLVTHNRATMSAANVLYGVTMDHEGVSRLLSIKLEDAEKVIDKP